MILPSLIEFSAYGGDWDAYSQAVYQQFSQDFIHQRAIFNGRHVFLNDSRCLMKGLEETFWHVTSEGKAPERVPDLRRMERIAWVREVLVAYPHEEIRAWRNVRERDTRTVVWVESEHFVVVLRTGSAQEFLLTAFVPYPSYERKLLKEYDEFVDGGGTM